MNALYNEIGKKYDLTRKADPILLQLLIDKLAPKKHQKFLDVGCGSGNYTIALHQKGLSITGLDISEEMLNLARNKYPKMDWILADAKTLPFKEQSFDGVLCFLAIHHIRELPTFFKEVHRILKSGGKFILFSNSPEQFLQLWLSHYFPQMMKKASLKPFTKKEIEENLKKSGFKDISFEIFFITRDTQDAFLELAKFHPSLCLDENFRKNTSPFALAPDPLEIEKGLQRLKEDIETNHIQTIFNQFQNRDGNFFFCESLKKN